MRAKLVLCGGSGFVGRVIAGKLAEMGHDVQIASRRPGSGTILTRYSRQSLETVFGAGDIVINLIGIPNESGSSGSGFRKAHVNTTRNICDAARASGVTRYLHMSALHASPRGPSHYLASKAEAEQVVRKSGLEYTIFRPSVIFGAGDSFTNRFAGLIRLSPFILPLACTDSRFQPVSVDDVAECFIQSLDLPETIGQDYNLCGPEVFTLKEIVELVAGTIHKRRKIIALNHGLSKLQARILQFVPGKPFTPDNFQSLQIDSICTNAGELPFRLEHHRLGDTMAGYLSPYRT